jgi:amino-acid N-acetyltransferase
MEALPSADITEEALQHFLVFRDERGVAGVVGLETSSDAALLRSLVVTGELIGRGVGRRLVLAAEALAAELGIRLIYLLTTSSSTFFEHLGFRSLDRKEAPLAIQGTREFVSLCPATAVLMVKP